MKFRYEGQIYPLIIKAQSDPADSEIFRTIAPDLMGDYWMLEFDSCYGVKIIDEISRDSVFIEDR